MADLDVDAELLNNTLESIRIPENQVRLIALTKLMETTESAKSLASCCDEDDSLVTLCVGIAAGLLMGEIFGRMKSNKVSPIVN